MRQIAQGSLAELADLKHSNRVKDLSAPVKRADDYDDVNGKAL